MSQEHGGGLFVSYDGLLEPLGQSQILPYVLSLADSGLRMHVVSFEKRADRSDEAKRNRLKQQLDSHNVAWSSLSYHSHPKILSTLFDLVVGTWTCIREARHGRAEIVHARSYVAAAMSLPVKWLTGASFVFDIRGFWPEERVQLGIFRGDGFMFRVVKRLERWFWRHTDRLIALTNCAKQELSSLPEWQDRTHDISVIPCCVDLRRFVTRPPNAGLLENHGLGNKRIVGNVGAVSRMYLLPEMFQFYVELKSRIENLHFVYLTRQGPMLLRKIASAAGIEPEELTVMEVDPARIPQWLSIFDLGLFFPCPTYATKAMSPTKLGEFLAAGVPVATSAEVGDIADIIEPGKTGVLLRGFSPAELAKGATAAREMIPASHEVRSACRKTAAEHFDLEKGCRRYISLYRELIGENPRVSPRLRRESA